ncbi:hypothetical protein BDZ97DRAFT_1792208 [Flammula alnicola]|nr:hypothetical protein BDZ97DRAFT_1792208 [Flammula alnicola]
MTGTQSCHNASAVGNLCSLKLLGQIILFPIVLPRNGYKPRHPIRTSESQGYY